MKQYNFLENLKYIYIIGLLGILSCLSASAQERNADAKKQHLSLKELRKLDYFYYEGIRLKNAEKFDESYEMFKHCLDIDSTSSAAMFEIASFLIQTNKPELAVALMKSSIKYAPDNQEYRSAFATLLFNMGMFGEASEEYAVLIKAYPDKPELNYYLAECYSRMGEIDKAIETFDELEKGVGMFEALSMEKFQLYMSIKQTKKAFGEIQKLADKFPMEPRYHIIMGDLHLNNNDTVKALSYYKKAHEIDSESPYYQVAMANYYEKTGQSEAAKEQINNALLNDKLDIETKANILTRYIQQLRQIKQDIEGANTLFETLLEQHPNDSQLKLMYGTFLSMQDKNDEARFQYQLVTESEPENLAAWQQLLNLSLQEENIDDAIRICTKCQEIFPESPEFYFYLGISYFQKKEFHQAIDTYKAGLPLIAKGNTPLMSNFYGQIGDTYFRINQIDSAFAAYEEALKYNDKNVVVLNNYAYYLSLLKKDLTKAERMSALCIKLEPENPTYLDTYAWIFFVQGNYSLAKIYIEKALSDEHAVNSELVDHYGDILFLSGEKDKAVEQWKKAKELGKDNETLNKKIAEKNYYEETEEEKSNEIQKEQ